MKLTDQEVDTVARRGQWYFDLYFGFPIERADSSVMTGQGVSDLDRTIDVMTFTGSMDGFRFQCDVGFNYSVYRNFDLEDVYRIRAKFIDIYGNVNKINAYMPKPSVVIQFPPDQVAVSVEQP